MVIKYFRIKEDYRIIQLIVATGVNVLNFQLLLNTQRIP